MFIKQTFASQPKAELSPWLCACVRLIRPALLICLSGSFLAIFWPYWFEKKRIPMHRSFGPFSALEWFVWSVLSQLTRDSLLRTIRSGKFRGILSGGQQHYHKILSASKSKTKNPWPANIVTGNLPQSLWKKGGSIEGSLKILVFGWMVITARWLFESSASMQYKTIKVCSIGVWL